MRIRAVALTGARLLACASLRSTSHSQKPCSSANHYGLANYRVSTAELSRSRRVLDCGRGKCLVPRSQSMRRRNSSLQSVSSRMFKHWMPPQVTRIVFCPVWQLNSSGWSKARRPGNHCAEEQPFGLLLCFIHKEMNNEGVFPPIPSIARPRTLLTAPSIRCQEERTTQACASADDEKLISQVAEGIR